MLELFPLTYTEVSVHLKNCVSAISVNVIDDPYVIDDTIITPPDGTADYIVSAYGPAFVYNADTSEVMTFTTESPAEGVDVKLTSNDNDYVIDNLGRVIFVGNEPSRATSLDF